MKAHCQELIAAAAQALAGKVHTVEELHAALFRLALDIVSPFRRDVPATIDATALRDALHHSNSSAGRHALWCSGYPGAEPNTCRYCGKHWRQWTDSKLDGHAACIVTEDFKQRLSEIFLSSPGVTYAMVASAIGVTPAVVRSWIHPIRRAS